MSAYRRRIIREDPGFLWPPMTFWERVYAFIWRLIP